MLNTLGIIAAENRLAGLQTRELLGAPFGCNRNLNLSFIIVGHCREIQIQLSSPSIFGNNISDVRTPLNISVTNNLNHYNIPLLLSINKKILLQQNVKATCQ